MVTSPLVEKNRWMLSAGCFLLVSSVKVRTYGCSYRYIEFFNHHHMIGTRPFPFTRIKTVRYIFLLDVLAILSPSRSEIRYAGIFI
jgi:hypothetical protein